MDVTSDTRATEGEARASPDGLWGAIRNRMEPNRVSTRLFGDVRSETPK